VNLITNSADVKKDATVTIKSFVRDDKVYVEVEDDGPGFPSEVQRDPSSAFNLNKNGYGLFLCKSIVDRHKGEIWILNRDAGAAVQFFLPLSN
jgi:signal transduction histidine kinase